MSQVAMMERMAALRANREQPLGYAIQSSRRTLAQTEEILDRVLKESAELDRYLDRAMARLA